MKKKRNKAEHVFKLSDTKFQAFHKKALALVKEGQNLKGSGQSEILVIVAATDESRDDINLAAVTRASAGLIMTALQEYGKELFKQ